MLQIRNLLRYLVAIGLNIFIMMALHSYINFVLLTGLLVFPIYSIYGTRKAGRSLQVHLRAPQEPMAKNEEFFVYIDVDNPTWFPLVNATLPLQIDNTFYKNWGQHELNIPVRAHQTTSVSYPVVMEQCGRFRMYTDHLICMDLLGIYAVKCFVEQKTECMILPKGQEREQEAGLLYQKGVSEAMESREKGYDFSDISGIREYIPGDKLQNIHWKLSTKKDELMVKERVSVSAMQLHVLVELMNDPQMQLESILALTDSVTRAFVRQNLPFTVHYYSVKKGGLQEMYIGNEEERKQWMMMMLYDVCYEKEQKAQELFQKEYPSIGQFLYIGPNVEGIQSQDMISGGHNTVAILL